MTGFATRRGEFADWTWVWDIRSVNGKGLDPRLRLPDWVEGLEPAARTLVGKSVARGNVTLALKLSRATAIDALRLNPAGFDAALTAIEAATKRAADRNVILAPATVAEVLSLRGVTELGAAEETDSSALLAALTDDLAPLLADFGAARRAEGVALGQVLSAQIDRIAELTDAAATAADARRAQVAAAFHENLARITSATDIDPARVAQELALLAVKADVTEELDRLRAHVAAARTHLTATEPVGRKLDFLIQEFMREANTLCSKAGNPALTAIGLDLKHVIDQMREQVQNVE
jgi:uncharacterized protein (TIGR00255 family)